MNSKIAKKIRRETRKQVLESFGDGLESLTKLIRQRPNWIPKKIWVVLYLPLFERKYLKTIESLIK